MITLTKLVETPKKHIPSTFQVNLVKGFEKIMQPKFLLRKGQTAAGLMSGNFPIAYAGKAIMEHKIYIIMLCVQSQNATPIR